jgi:hypothetical protein
MLAGGGRTLEDLRILAARNLEFVQACERKMPKGKRTKAVRMPCGP